MYAAVAGVMGEDFDALVRAGVPRRFLYRGAMRFGIAFNHTYQPTDIMQISAISPSIAGSRHRAFIIPASPIPPLRDLDDGALDLGDLIAFRLEAPGQWWCRTGNVPILNFEAVERADYMREPLRVHVTPLDWMRAGGEGAVILDRRVNLRLWLGGIKTLICDTTELGTTIERRLRDPAPRPRIVVPSRSVKAAA
jgi:hypothetical protein